MEIPKIDNFLDVVATALIVITVLYSVIALFGNNKAIRLGAILLVASLAIYSDSFGSYFAAIFIVATAVTELEFLEKLAAIIRGNKDYFDYKKSQVPVDEAMAKAGADASAVETSEQSPEKASEEDSIAKPEFKSGEEKLGHILPAGSAASAGYAIEQLTLSYFERRLGSLIQRNIRFSTPRAEVEFDGIVEKGMGRSDTLIEVKLASTQRFESTALRGANEFMKRKATFKKMTGRRTTGIIIVVVQDKQEIKNIIESVKAEVESLAHTLQFEVVDFKDIGYSSE